MICRRNHQHLTDRARRGCDAFDRAYARFERRDAMKGQALWSDDRAFALWMDASRLVNALFPIAMSDVDGGR